MPEDLQKKIFSDSEFLDLSELAEQEEQDDSIERAFAEINARLDEGMAEFDERMKRINAMLPKDEPKRSAQNDVQNEVGAAENEFAENPEEDEIFCETQAEPEPYDPERAAKQVFLSEKLREAGRIGVGASWQLLLGFGISLALRIGILGVWLGSYVDRRWLGDTGIGAAVIIVLVIFYSFYMLYHDLMRIDKQNREEREKVRREAEEEWARRHGGS